MQKYYGMLSLGDFLFLLIAAAAFDEAIQVPSKGRRHLSNPCGSCGLSHWAAGQAKKTGQPKGFVSLTLLREENLSCM